MSNTIARTTPASVEADSWIETTPGVCGGEPCIRDTRITVRGLVSYRNLGLSDQQIREAITGLTQADLQVAWDYYANHRGEIDQAIRDNDEA